MWFQHDGAPPHFSIVARQVLNRDYRNRWIGRSGPVSWPPRSPDLRPLDFFSWGYMKSLIYETPVQSEEDPIARIATAAGDISDRPRTIKRVHESLENRCRLCITCNGRQFEQFLWLDCIVTITCLIFGIIVIVKLLTLIFDSTILLFYNSVDCFCFSWILVSGLWNVSWVTSWWLEGVGTRMHSPPTAQSVKTEHFYSFWPRLVQSFKSIIQILLHILKDIFIFLRSDEEFSN